MKRCNENVSSEIDTDELPKNKVLLVERTPEPGGVALVNPIRTSKKSYVELMELEENVHNAEAFIQANTRNKLDVIGKQMKNLYGLMHDVVQGSRLHTELNNASCNFIKKPGHMYHLYEKPSGQKYFSMLSPEEWVTAPHTFLGSFKLEADMSWTPAGQEETRYEGINFLREAFSSSSRIKALLSSNT